MAEDKKEKLKRQKDIGQFFTPQEVVGFIFDMLKVHLDKEERWRVCVGKKRKRLKRPSIIDPACGEGIFLKIALEKKITYPLHIFGVDIDDKMKEEWKRINLLAKFGSEARLESRFFHQNGLLPVKRDPKYKYRGVKKNALKEFDLVVGNPPYGGVGLKEITPELEEALLSFDVWRRAFRRNAKEQGELFDKSQIEVLGSKRKERLEKFPIEVLFIDRFIQLTKPGGHIAIIVPDGILSNSNLHYVREFITDNVKVEAIVSLPRGTFKNVGTSAKTSILFMTKPLDGKIDFLDCPVFLATVQKLEWLSKVYELYCRYQKEGNLMNPVPRKVVIAKDSEGNELVMVRADKTAKEVMECKPNSRWDASFWKPIYSSIIEEMEQNNIVRYFEDFIATIGQGDVPRKRRGEKFVEKGVRFIEVEHIKNTGIYFYDTRFVMEKQYNRLKRVEIAKDSILIVRSGATIGKITIVTTVYGKAIVNGHINRIICKDINPYYITVFMKTRYGQLQLEQLQRGVAQPELNFDEIMAIKIPIISNPIQLNIESEYKKMSAYHDKAMEAKAKGDEVNYKKNITTAEKMLKDLIARAEAVIRGEREDVI
jgi:hypothetical protein